MTTKAAARRTKEEVAALCAQVPALIEGGMLQSEALRKLKLSDSVYKRWKQTTESGSVGVDLVPPRPARKKGGYKPAVVDYNSVTSLLKRLLTVEKQLAKVKHLRDEEAKVKQRLKILLR